MKNRPDSRGNPAIQAINDYFLPRHESWLFYMSGQSAFKTNQARKIPGLVADYAYSQFLPHF
jgi:hypothetical protein